MSTAMLDQPGSTSAPVPTARDRATPLRARGEPMVWLTGACLALCALMVATLLTLVVLNGAGAFWPREIQRITYRENAELADGPTSPTRTIMGIETAREAFDPSPEERAEIELLRKSGRLPAGALDDQQRPMRVQVRAGNKDVTGQPFVWIPLHRIVKSETPPDAVMVERSAWGPWFGQISGVIQRQDVQLPGPAESIVASETKKQGSVIGAGATERIDRKVMKQLDGGRVLVQESTTIAPDDAVAAMAEFRRVHAIAVVDAAKAQVARTREIGAINAAMESLRLGVRQDEIDLARAEQIVATGGNALPEGLWWGSLGGIVLGLAGLLLVWPRNAGVMLHQSPGRRATLAAVRAGIVLLLICSAAFAYLQRPGSIARATPETVELLRAGLERTRADAAAKQQELQGRYKQVLASIAEIESRDSSRRVLFTDSTTGRFAPIRQSETEEPMLVSQVVRAIQPNTMGFFGKLGVFFDRWSEFVFDEPREANTEGGIFPVIFGTVMLTFLLSVLVVPLGVVAAIYLREYARQGPVTSALRVAINNLAGVPSIVYGVFGLGFFCYTVGQYVDQGPGVGITTKVDFNNVNFAGIQADGISTSAAVVWWLGVVVLAVIFVGAVFLGVRAKPTPGEYPTGTQRWLSRLAALAWFAVAGVIVLLIATTPYFNGLFESSLPGHKFGTKGILWSALTLALLTLPVVIVATEEAIAAVPRTMREGSYGCGASKWQTIQRIVLPRAMPGIMTGMILAMARGAGEVAPLMLVGAVKLAPDLPISAQAPFVHLDRPFMHLGFHVYDVGFQSPDAEAARPLVWCTTLLLILVVVSLNAVAIRVRSNLRRKFFGESF